MNSHTWWRHPRGVFLVAFTELWERFSYWGMAGLLVLYLTAAPASGGWGWADADAVRLYGWYGGLAFILPVAGAWLANTFLGERRCILWGGLAITFGNVLLISPVVAPVIGRTLFMAGLALIALGTGLLKPTISSIVAHLYPTADARRDEGFSFFFVAIYIGALLGALVAGYLGERVGWHYGFAAAAVGMGFGMLCYLSRQAAWLGEVGRIPTRQVLAERKPLTSEEWDRVRVLLVQGSFTVLYAAGFYQMYGLLNLYAHRHLDRNVLGFEIPTTWLQTVSLWSFFICVPLLAWVWRSLASRARNPSASWKLALGLSALGVGYLVLVAAEMTRAEGAMPHVSWLIVTYALFGLGDSLVWANQISLTSKLAPARWSVTFIGGWYVCIGLGTWLTGYIGALVESYAHREIFFMIGGGCLVAAALLGALTPALRRRMHGAERLEIAVTTR